jgi:hypothetical protein
MVIQLVDDPKRILDPAEARKVLERDAMLDAGQRESLPAITQREIACRTLVLYAALGALSPGKGRN